MKFRGSPFVADYQMGWWGGEGVKVFGGNFLKGWFLGTGWLMVFTIRHVVATGLGTVFIRWLTVFRRATW